MYLDREWRMPQPADSPIYWPGVGMNVGVYFPDCCGWHVTGSIGCFTDPIGVLILYGNDWTSLPLSGAWRGTAASSNQGTLTAVGVAGININIVIKV